MADDRPIQTTDSKVVYQNRWMTIHEDKTTMVSGKPGVYGYLESMDSVIAAVVDAQGRLAMVRGFRYPSKSWGWEFPGGAGEEDSLADVKREIAEETGFTAEYLEKIGESYVCNGFMTEKQHTFVVYDLSGEATHDFGEDAISEMRFFSRPEINDLLDAGEINDNQTITALFFFDRWLNANPDKVPVPNENK